MTRLERQATGPSENRRHATPKVFVRMFGKLV